MTLYGIGPAGSDLLTVRGRCLFMAKEGPLVTSDPEDVADRNYYTLAYAEKRSVSTSE